MNKFFLIAVLIYSVMLITGFMGDVIFTPFGKIGDMWVFRGSRTMGLTLANLAILFAGTILLIGLTAISRKQQGTLTVELLVRQMVIGLLFTVFLISSFAGSVYILSKRITADNSQLTYYSLLERKEVPWSEVKDFRGNFVAGSKFGLGKGEYGWIEFTTQEGKVIHFSLRFMGGVNQLKRVIEQRLAKK